MNSSKNVTRRSDHIVGYQIVVRTEDTDLGTEHEYWGRRWRTFQAATLDVEENILTSLHPETNGGLIGNGTLTVSIRRVLALTGSIASRECVSPTGWWTVQWDGYSDTRDLVTTGELVVWASAARPRVAETRNELLEQGAVTREELRYFVGRLQARGMLTLEDGAFRALPCAG